MIYELKRLKFKMSVSYQKKDGRGHARPSFFWYDNDKELKVCFLVTRVKLTIEPKQDPTTETPVTEKRIMGRTSSEVSGSFCCVPGCHNRSGKDKKNGEERSYYRLPSANKYPDLRALWINAIPRKDWNPDAMDHRICSDHFVGNKRSLLPGSPGYIPSIWPEKRMRGENNNSGSFCCAPGCSNRSGKDKKKGVKRHYYSLPSATERPQLRKAWIEAIPRTDWDPDRLNWYVFKE